jgi:hypothetical protein
MHCRSGLQHNHRAPGPDGLPNELFSHVAGTLASHIAGVFDGIFHTHTAPAVMSPLSRGIVVPPPKPGKLCGPQALQNLRPVNLLSTLRNTLSTRVLHRVRPILERYVGSYQSGFRPGRRTGDNVAAK